MKKYRKIVQQRKPIKYTIEWFIAKFTSIPAKNWTLGVLNTSDGRSCLLGHCGVTDYKKPTKEAKALHKILFGKNKYRNSNLYNLNDFTGRPRGTILNKLKKKIA